MADDPTGFAIDSIQVQTPTHNDTGEDILPAAVPFPGRIVNKLTMTYSNTGEAMASPAYCIVFTNSPDDISTASVIVTPEGEQSIASVSHVRDELGVHHHTKVVFS